MGDRRLVGLEALRGIAALAVVFGHASSISNTPLLFVRMHLAVDLFFILSGYVMARSYEPRMAKGYSTWAFLFARLRRIWPTMALGACLGAVVFWQYHSTEKTLLLFAAALVFVPVVTRGWPVFPVNVPAWSVMFELVANVAHALVLRRLGLGLLGAVTAASAIVFMALQTGTNPGVNDQEFALGLPRVMACYGIGVMLWRVLRDRPVLPVWIGLAGFPLVILASHFVPLDAIWFDWIFMFALGPVFVVSGLAQPPLRRLFVFLGMLSFPLYAVHGPVQEYVRKSLGGGMWGLLFGGLGAGLVFLLAIHARPWLARLIEVRGRRTARAEA